MVVCNGCTDRTADVARAYGDDVSVIETPKLPRLPPSTLATVSFPDFRGSTSTRTSRSPSHRCGGSTSRLGEGDALAASPVMHVDLRGSSLAVRGYYRIWVRLPYVRDGMIGVGVYALSEDGRRRFETFPDVIADDGYVRMLFGPGERVRVDDAPVRIYAPERLSDLVRIKTRSRLGRYELRRRFPDLVADERTTKSYRDAVGTIALRPWLWPAAIVYAVVQLQSRRRASKQLASIDEYVWERDDSSRRPSRR